MRQLGQLDEWLAQATAAAQRPAVRFSSLFPVYRRHAVRRAARRALAAAAFGQSALEGRAVRAAGGGGSAGGRKAPGRGQWTVDGESECLIPSAARGPRRGPVPHRVAASAAVDVCIAGRRTLSRTTACLEFRAGRRALDRGGVRGPGGRGPLGRTGEGRVPPAGGFRIRRRTFARLGPPAAPEFSEGDVPRDDCLGARASRAVPAWKAKQAPAAGDRLLAAVAVQPRPEDAVDWRRGSYALCRPRRPRREPARLRAAETCAAHGGRRLGAVRRAPLRAAPRPTSLPMDFRIRSTVMAPGSPWPFPSTSRVAKVRHEIPAHLL